MNFSNLKRMSVAGFCTWLVPGWVSAHKVDNGNPAASPGFRQVVSEHLGELLLWWSLSLVVIVSVLAISITRRVEELIDPLLLRVKKYAPFVMQITLGADLLYSAYNNAFLGAELALPALYGPAAFYVQILLVVLGALLLAGVVPRIASFFVLLLFIVPISAAGVHILNYGVHFGEAIALLALGGTYQLASSNFSVLPELRRSLELHLHKYKFLLLRAAFGSSIIYTAVHGSYIHAASALATVRQTGITDVLAIEPSFFVVLVMSLQILLGLFYIVGFEIRFASLVYLVSLLCLVIFFDSQLWPNVILLGTASAMLVHGYDRFSVGGRLLKRGNLEPVL